MRLLDDYQPDDLEVKVSELLVATADGHDRLLDDAVPEVLKLLREKMSMDVVFVSEFIDGKRAFRHVEQTPGQEVIAQGDSEPLEASWCQRVVDGRLPELMPNAEQWMASGAAPRPPFPIGTHLSTPIVMKDGSIYGTLCCFSFGENKHINERDLKNLKFTAKLAAGKIEQEKARNSADILSLAPVPELPARGGFKGSL
jgi:GAF domain-containing protein